MLKPIYVTTENLKDTEERVRDFLFNATELIEGYSHSSPNGSFEPTDLEKSSETGNKLDAYGGSKVHRYISTGYITTHIGIGDRVWISDHFVIIDHMKYGVNPHYLPLYTIIHTGLDVSVLGMKFDIDTEFRWYAPLVPSAKNEDSESEKSASDATTKKENESGEQPKEPPIVDICGGRYKVQFVFNDTHMMTKIFNHKGYIHGHGTPLCTLDKLQITGGSINCGGITGTFYGRAESIVVSVHVAACSNDKDNVEIVIKPDYDKLAAMVA